MKRLLIFISFFVFLKAYFASRLWCNKCNSSGCSFSPTCAEGEVCLTIFSKVGSIVKVVDTICGKKEHCGQSFSQLVRGQKETNFTSCCESSSCIPSEQNAFRNGIMCPFCTKEGSMECTPTNYECMGKANVCYTYTAPGRIIRGCGSKELCGDPMNSFITFEDDGGRTNCTEKSTEDSG